MLDAVLHFLDRFVPDARRSDPVELRQSYLLVGLLMSIICTMPINIVQQVLTQQWPLLFFSIITVVFYTGALLLYRPLGRHDASSQLLLIWGFAAVVGTSAMSGGIYSPVMPFLAMLPLLALALRNRRSAVLWMALAVAAIAAMAFASDQELDLRAQAAIFEKPYPIAANLLLMVSYCAGFAWFLESLNQLHRDQLVEQRIQADDANAAKSEFLANMSHELRTPMNGVLGLTEIVLLDSNLATQHRDRLQTVLQSGRALVDLLNDILDLSKVEAGQLVLEEIPWNPRRVMGDVELLFGEVARRKGLELSLEVQSDNLPEWVMGDPTRVRQVVCNLVGNAVKFTERGSVRIQLSSHEGQLRLSVKDTGPGISTTVQARIFEPFTQADASTARRHGGTGLGLTICRRLTTMMGGNLVVESILGSGSTFVVQFPIRPSEAPGGDDLRPAHPAADWGPRDPAPAVPPAPAEPPSVLVSETTSPPGRRVLLVEDVEVNRMVTTTMLQQLGCSVDVAEDGARGLATILGDPSYDLVLMDWHLPELTGLEVTRLVRLAGHELPIVGLSASVRPEEKQEAINAGMNGFLGKPFSRDALESTLMATFQSAPAGQPASAHLSQHRP